ncbi:MAG: hypothetical protein M3155_00115 [Actinomycetota bacterium]|nr:hypothetical protein [Actinomycetota bacterium]
MAIARMFENPAVSQEQYDAVRERLGVGEGNMPDGGLVHVAGPSPDGGWRVVEVWESEEAAAKFDTEQVEPALQAAGVQRPAPQVWPVHNLVKS